LIPSFEAPVVLSIHDRRVVVTRRPSPDRRRTLGLPSYSSKGESRTRHRTVRAGPCSRATVRRRTSQIEGGSKVPVEVQSGAAGTGRDGLGSHAETAGWPPPAIDNGAAKRPRRTLGSTVRTGCCVGTGTCHPADTSPFGRHIAARQAFSG
jgi:hypothetical protein